MIITHSYLGTSIGPYRCQFFLLLEDYIEAQSELVRDVDAELERFARSLGHAAAVVRSFEGDIDATRCQVLDKPWQDEQQSEIMRTPGLLMINVDFDVFDPRTHPWVYFHFGEKIQRQRPSLVVLRDVDAFRRLLHDLSELVRDPDKDAFGEVHRLLDGITAQDVLSVFEAKPGIFGFSIDLIRLGSLLRGPLAAKR